MSVPGTKKTYDANKYNQFVAGLPTPTAAKYSYLGFNQQGHPMDLVALCSRQKASEGLAAMDAKLEWNEKIVPEDFLRRGGDRRAALFDGDEKDSTPFQNLDEIFRFLHRKGDGFLKRIPADEKKTTLGEEYDLGLLTQSVPTQKKNEEFGSILGKIQSSFNARIGPLKMPWYERVDKRASVAERIFSPDIWADRLGEMMTFYSAVTEDKLKLPMSIEIVSDQVEGYSKKGQDVWDVLRTYRTIRVEDLLTRVRVEGQQLVADQHGRAPLEYEKVWQHLDEITARMPAAEKFSKRQLIDEPLGRHYFDPLFKEEIELPGGTLMRKAFEMGQVENFFKLSNRSGKLLDRIEAADVLAVTAQEPKSLLEICHENGTLEVLFQAKNWRLNPRAPHDIFKVLPAAMRKDAPYDPEKKSQSHALNFASALQASRSDEQPPSWIFKK